MHPCLLMVSSELNCNRAMHPCFPTTGSLRWEAGEVAAVVPCLGIGVGENALGMVLNPFWGGKVAGGGLSGAMSRGWWRLGARPIGKERRKSV
jgi:hypothetical protein